MKAQDPLRLGIVGAGGFGQFVAGAATQLPDVALVAVADTDRARARNLAEAHGAAVAVGVQDLLADDRVEAVVIATPPNTHASLTLAALAAGRHVFCEKPTALSEADASQVHAAVLESGCAYVVDHVLRYNPILSALGWLRRAGLLGPLQRFAFENDAADEGLPVEHWFWDDALSGGILLEHGVHFFDAASAFIDAPARAVQAIGHTRTDGLTDTVVCTVVHSDGTLASYAHGFSHAHRAERQLMRLDFGLGEARVHGWIPLRADLDVWTDRAAEFAGLPDRAQELFAVPGFEPSGLERVDVTVELDVESATTRSRGVEYRAPHHVRLCLDLGFPDAKQRVYRHSVAAALHDLTAAARSGATPLAGIDAGEAAVRVAAAATRALHDGRTHHLTSMETSCADSPCPATA